MPGLGVLGTMVWDRIYARDGRAEPVEEWGGIAYALAAASAVRDGAWRIVPVVKIGRDLEARAFDFFAELPDLDHSSVRVVDEPSNRVELRYRDRERRCERMTGGISAWSWDELAPAVASLDALYVNFISGFEMDLATAIQLRLAFRGPIYADLHSLFLGIDAAGVRSPRPLEAWREWLRCFDIVQVNEDELGILAYTWGDPWRFAAEVVGADLRLLFVTLGARGAAYVATDEAVREPLPRREPGLVPGRPLVAPARVLSERVEPADGVQDGDPTGCGDAWGATCFLRLLAGDDLHAAMRTANALAARNVLHRGATGLHLHLRGRIAT
jgi:sugar/nucleoside kinase (ribokinase family)